MKHKTAIIGNKETILGFKALGLQTFNANDPEEATEILFKLKGEQMQDPKTGEMKNTFAIVFITEDLAMGISEDNYKKLSQSALPAIVPVPGSQGASGYGLKRIGKMVEQAIGSDILG